MIILQNRQAEILPFVENILQKIVFIQKYVLLLHSEREIPNISQKEIQFYWIIKTP